MGRYPVNRSALRSVLLCAACCAMLQDICPQGEWEQFVEVLKKPLPITFRINGSGRYANELRENLESDFFANFSKGPIVVSSSCLLHTAVWRCAHGTWVWTVPCTRAAV